jgi:cupin superfamily acireductone dioxygenase involved in methionine salvage
MKTHKIQINLQANRLAYKLYDVIENSKWHIKIDELESTYMQYSPPRFF